MPTAQKRRERIACRISPELKTRIANAADVMGLTTSEFIVSKAVEAADEVLRSHQTVMLSERDWDIIMEANAHPGELNESLIQAAARFKQGKEKGDSYEW